MNNIDSWITGGWRGAPDDGSFGGPEGCLDCDEDGKVCSRCELPKSTCGCKLGDFGDIEDEGEFECVREEWQNRFVECSTCSGEGQL